MSDRLRGARVMVKMYGLDEGAIGLVKMSG